MAIFTKLSNRMVRVNASESKNFKERFNKNVITPKHIEECNAARRLFHNETHKN